MRRPCLSLSLLFSLSVAAAGNSLDAAVGEATRRMEARDFHTASTLLGGSVQLYPKEIRLWNLLGISEGELGRTASAQNAFERGIEVAPNSVPLNENLGFLYYRQERYADAKPYLAKAVALGSRNAGTAFSLAAARVRTGEREKALAGLKGLEGALATYPDYWAERGWAELTENPSTAEASFSRALNLAPAHVRALNGAAAAAEMRNLDEKALSFLVRARQARPNDVDTLVHFGNLCLRRDLIIDALAALERAHELAPSNNSALFSYARAQIGVQQWQKAYDTFSEFARRAPTFASTYYALGWLDIKLNRRTEARKNLEHCLKLASRSADPAYELAQLDLEDGQLELAEKRLRGVLDEEPRHAKANVAYGDLLLKRGDLEGAKTHLETAIASDPSSGPAHYKLSTVLSRLGHPEQAAQERALGTQLNAEALKSSKIVLRLASPDGALLSVGQ